MSHAPRVAAVLAAVVVIVVAGCAGGGTPSEQPTEITVFAAASLQKTFTRLGREFESANPGTRVVFTFAGSSDLLSQLQNGAQADLFASADTATMDKAVADDLLSEEPLVFASNSMEIAVPPGNPAGVDSVESLADPTVKLVVCAPQVPCGAATQAVSRNSGVVLSPVSEESSVTDVLGKVMSGEADAGIVYVTDVTGAADAVKGIDIPRADNAVNNYPIGVLADSGDPALARRFVDYILSAEGRAVLADAGFGTP
jgi:molybdate transport system substrate-binding protein